MPGIETLKEEFAVDVTKWQGHKLSDDGQLLEVWNESPVQEIIKVKFSGYTSNPDDKKGAEALNKIVSQPNCKGSRRKNRSAGSHLTDVFVFTKAETVPESKWAEFNESKKSKK